ncbi:bifunctional 2-polyprenyl-6-hydroxyphenol methylase/3-demethylubiquinol 3-O-methyltransferase UbiG [Pseudoponticoccus marisrubri]|uniref:Bifunctional 3-demethylubiquinone 3-O-methyltransferase/2-octaprenyl-6-hydroxy phenol methylase n=1 Tax=Pseudoponticoccus marisrubri TaxID=1685382 RepID=A0A0W7WDK9_9RHOB|nr:bifunctional 2-polyprenyl-6-hydroxyphenol methylase/3-demethylubiquinol 3-O-methyltransferase UbiG [Pseudoponticoccus marisrubri]KUF08666.1 bifunctional 3-demethylubiquinone 3-O-methyltransferase/2-octaprenyl-6-hydroxy phenol methylase [Pseudoponticoccus marisrubri]
MPDTARNDLEIYNTHAAQWWSDEIRWVRTLKNLVPGRLAWFDHHVSWEGAEVLDLGCAGGFMAEALTTRGARVTGIDPAEAAIAAGRARAQEVGQTIRYDVGVGEDLPYDDASFDMVVCVDVLEHVSDLRRVLAEVARVLRPGGVFLYDTINRNPVSRLGAITVAEDLLGLLPKGTHDPELFIKPEELRAALETAGLRPGPTKGLGPRGINRRGDFTFGPVPTRAVIYMGVAHKPEGVA